ncbi:MAG: serine hydrolase [Roseivirga sp.]|nr:serine hydrolase [Roseivirga sp.]
MKHSSSFFLAVLFFLTAPLLGQTNADLEARISRIENNLMQNLQIEGEETPVYNINERLKQLNIPGLSIAFVSNGKVEWARAYGMADRNENRPMTTETMLLAGSISKPVAALRAHQLVEAGKFDLDVNVNNYLKSWKLPENEFTEKKKVTLRGILNHTAGLTVWGFPGYDKGDKIPTTAEVLDGKGNTDSVRVYKEPGESWMYSGGGYTIMQLMVTDTEQMSFPETMQRHVLDPMNMQKSTFENPLPDKYHSIAATGYRGNGTEVEGKWPIYPEMAAAGLWTTPTQLIQYAIEVQKINNSKKDGILKYSSVKEMLIPGMNGHGLGPQTTEHMFGHGGADEGFRAQLFGWKEHPHAVVVMVNSDNGSIMQEVLLAVAKEYNLPGIEPDKRKNIKMADADLQKYTGKYKLERMGNLELKLDKGHLYVHAGFVQEPLQLNAEGNGLFYAAKDGVRFTFDIKDDKVTGFEVQRLKAVRVKE